MGRSKNKKSMEGARHVSSSMSFTPSSSASSARTHIHAFMTH